MFSKNKKNRKIYNQFKELIIVYLSDSNASETNIPLRLMKIISKEYLDYKIIFKKLNFHNIFHILFIMIKSRIFNKVILIHSHHLKSLILNIFFKLIANIFSFKLITYHSFLCELKRFSNLKKNLRNEIKEDLINGRTIWVKNKLYTYAELSTIKSF